MEKYKDNGRCKKCGCHYISSEYIASWCDGGQLLRTCRNCGYWWYERPLDSGGE